jgi:signal transduction histidine kinase
VGTSAAVIAIIGSALFSAVVMVVPSVHVSYTNENFHVALNAIEGTVAVVLTYIWWGRVRVDHRLRDALLVVAFAGFAAANLGVSVLPEAAAHDPGLLWTAAVWRLGAAAAFAVAAFARGTITRWQPFVAVGGLIVAAGIVAGIVGRHADLGLLGIEIPRNWSYSRFHGHALLGAAQVAGLLLYSAAAVGFWRGAMRANDVVVQFLAAAAVLAAFARVHFVFFPSLYTDVVFSGDALRAAAYVMLSVAGALEIRRYWRAVASDAVTEERRRTARELHDGIVQELAFIRLRLSALDVEAGGTLRDVAESAQRALAESRQLIPILADHQPPEALVPVLQSTVDDAAARFGVHVEVRASASPVVPLGSAQALARVVREAISNAALHGGASAIVVQLTAPADRLFLTVRDNGCGFDPAVVRPSGFGLTSMRERVEGLGGRCTVSSAPGGGSEIRLEIPA